jgi:hypothetical protein
MLSSLIWAGVCFGQGAGASPLTISSALANLAVSPTQLTITGNNFGTVTPLVTLGGVALTVTSFSNTSIVASLPAALALGTSYPLTVTSASQARSSATFDVTLGITGSQGDAGPQGATGPQGPTGSPGPGGSQGVAGPQGPAGSAGFKGAPGLLGAAGAKGLPGQGIPGSAGAAGPSGPQGALGQNKRSIALLKWFPAYQNTSFGVGANPEWMTFDGATMWVAGEGTITGVRVSDGATVATFYIPGPVLGNSLPTGFGIAYDGANLWVTASDITTWTAGNTVFKLRASDGANLGAFGVGNGPHGVVFDGANIWVANSDNSTVTKLRAGDGGNLGTFPVGLDPAYLAFDGANIWVGNYGDGTVTKLRASDGVNLGTFSVGAYPLGLTFDGANVWVANFYSSTVTKLRASDGANMGTFYAGPRPYGLAFDGTSIWVASYYTVTRLRASDGANIGNFPAGDLGATGIAFDGVNVWVANASGDGMVTKL